VEGTIPASLIGGVLYRNGQGPHTACSQSTFTQCNAYPHPSLRHNNPYMCLSTSHASHRHMPHIYGYFNPSHVTAACVLAACS